MKSSSDRTEPTLHDVIDVITGVVQTGLDTMRKEMRMEIGGVKSELHELNGRVGKLETKLCDMDENLITLAQAFDKASVTLLDHGRRIIRLERAILA